MDNFYKISFLMSVLCLSHQLFSTNRNLCKKRGRLTRNYRKLENQFNATHSLEEASNLLSQMTDIAQNLSDLYNEQTLVTQWQDKYKTSNQQWEEKITQIENLRKSLQTDFNHNLTLKQTITLLVEQALIAEIISISYETEEDKKKKWLASHKSIKEKIISTYKERYARWTINIGKDLYPTEQLVTTGNYLLFYLNTIKPLIQKNINNWDDKYKEICDKIACLELSQIDPRILNQTSSSSSSEEVVEPSWFSWITGS